MLRIIATMVPRSWDSWTLPHGFVILTYALDNVTMTNKQRLSWLHSYALWCARRRSLSLFPYSIVRCQLAPVVSRTTP